VKFHPLTSSNLQAVAYDPTSRVLEVKFHGGNHYRYHDVDPKTHEALLSAESAGKYFGAHIRGKHRHEEVKKP